MLKDKPFLVRFTKEEKKRLKKYARSLDISQAEALRRLVSYAPLDGYSPLGI